jgi:ribosome recycling factor
MINEVFKETTDRMNKVISHCTGEISIIRTGRASTNLLDVIRVDYYGTMSPLNNIANITSPSPELIVVQPFDPSSLETIEKAIVSSNIGMTPNNDGNLIRLNVPPLTEERRNELIKLVHQYVEEAKVSIRNIRRDSNDQLKKFEKDKELSEDNLKRALENIQETTDEYIKKLVEIQELKEKDILL